uniref:Uncharacterized protein n=1 Tax=Arundo donax TaxID=35708 RepID=A0A0A9DBC0_ARUDO
MVLRCSSWWEPVVVAGSRVGIQQHRVLLFGFWGRSWMCKLHSCMCLCFCGDVNYNCVCDNVS